MGSVAGRHCKFQYNILSSHLLITMSDKWPNSSHLFEPFMSLFFMGRLMFFGLLCSHFNLCDKHIDIVLSIDGACILANIVNVDPIHAIKNSIHPIVLKKLPLFKKLA